MLSHSGLRLPRAARLRGPVLVDRVSISGSSGTVVSTTQLKSPGDKNNSYGQYAVAGSTIVGPDRSRHSGDRLSLLFWHYPKGDSPSRPFAERGLARTARSLASQRTSGPAPPPLGRSPRPRGRIALGAYRNLAAAPIAWRIAASLHCCKASHSRDLPSRSTQLRAKGAGQLSPRLASSWARQLSTTKRCRATAVQQRGSKRAEPDRNGQAFGYGNPDRIGLFSNGPVRPGPPNECEGFTLAR